MAHQTIRCSCGKILSTCRCIGPKEVVISPEPCPHPTDIFGASRKTREEAIDAAVEAAAEAVWNIGWAHRMGPWPEGCPDPDTFRSQEREALLPALKALEQNGFVFVGQNGLVFVGKVTRS